MYLEDNKSVSCLNSLLLQFGLDSVKNIARKAVQYGKHVFVTQSKG